MIISDKSLPFFFSDVQKLVLVSQNADLNYMARSNEYKAVGQQNCIFEQRLKDKLSRKSAKQTKTNN